ncbi:hypothetical protein COOONC_15347 [Cooperia oncophora]
MESTQLNCQCKIMIKCSTALSRSLKSLLAFFKRENPQASVVAAIVAQCNAQADVGDKYYVNKYPTMKVFVNGELIQKEYRSTRSVDALTAFVKYQLSTAINEFTNQDQLTAAMDTTKRNVVAWVKRGGDEYTNLKKFFFRSREECVFWVANCRTLHCSLAENTAVLTMSLTIRKSRRYIVLFFGERNSLLK